MINFNYRKQSAFVLALVLVFLLVLTSVVISMNSSVLAQEKMIAARQQSNWALEAAEGALRVAEKRLRNSDASSLEELVEKISIVEKGKISSNLFDDATWDVGENASIVDVKELNLLLNQGGEDNNNVVDDVKAKYFIEHIGSVIRQSEFSPDEIANNGVSLSAESSGFRIVARGEYVDGGKSLSQRVLVSYFAREFD